MGPSNGDDSRASGGASPYREPVELDVDGDEPGSPSWRRPSSKVLGALARLSAARGASETSEALSTRAAEVKRSEPSPKLLVRGRLVERCTTGNDALDRGDLDAAFVSYSQWLAEVESLSVPLPFRAEALAAVNVVERARGSRTESGFRRSLRLARLPADAPLMVTVAIGDVLNQLEEWARASESLERHPRGLDRPRAAHVAAEAALGLGRLDAASELSARALAAWQNDPLCDGPGHLATCILVGRVQRARGEHDAAERTIASVLGALHGARWERSLLEALALSARAELRLDAKAPRDALADADRAADVARDAAPRDGCVLVRAYRVLANALAACEKLDGAVALATEIERIRASFGA